MDHISGDFLAFAIAEHANRLIAERVVATRTACWWSMSAHLRSNNLCP